jgi:hypothetical protein
LSQNNQLSQPESEDFQFKLLSKIHKIRIFKPFFGFLHAISVDVSAYCPYGC